MDIGFNDEMTRGRCFHAYMGFVGHLRREGEGKTQDSYATSDTRSRFFYSILNFMCFDVDFDVDVDVDGDGT